MLTRPLHHLRRNPVPYVALLLVLAVGAGGGYALAATKTKTITVCADKKTGILHLKTRGRCERGQTRVTWNQQGPQGPQGLQGPAGQPGAPAAAAWAHVLASGAVFAGQGVSIQHQSAGTYQLTINAPACAQGLNAPVVTVDGGPPNGRVPRSRLPGSPPSQLESIRCVHRGRDEWIVQRRPTRSSTWWMSARDAPDKPLGGVSSSWQRLIVVACLLCSPCLRRAGHADREYQ